MSRFPSPAFGLGNRFRPVVTSGLGNTVAVAGDPDFIGLIPVDLGIGEPLDAYCSPETIQQACDDGLLFLFDGAQTLPEGFEVVTLPATHPVARIVSQSRTRGLKG